MSVRLSVSRRGTKGHAEAAVEVHDFGEEEILILVLEGEFLSPFLYFGGENGTGISISLMWL